MKLLGAVVSGALAGVLVAGSAFAEANKSSAPTPDTKPAPKGCWHTCHGHASCKGNGNESCKGKNTCAMQGGNNKKCAAAKTEEACGKVQVKKANICSWQT